MRRKKRKARSSKEPAGLKRRLLRGVPFLLLMLLFVFVFNRVGLLAKLETTVLDTLMRIDAPTQKSAVVIININQQDFTDFFKGQSRPLNPLRLQELITAVAKGNPCVIGVDIDTSFPQFTAKDFVLSGNWSNVVWVRETEEVPRSIDEAPVPLDVLGGRPDFKGNSGLALLIEDPSGVIRRYKRLFETDGGPLPSFPWAVFQQSRKCPGIVFPKFPAKVDSSPLLINYSRPESVERKILAASHVIQSAQDDDWPNNTLINGKIVLIGGTYLGEDLHSTPLGEMSGVELNANVIETEMRGGGIKSPGFLLLALLSLFDGLLVIALFHIFPWPRAMLFSVPAILLLSLLCSWLTYKSLAQWPIFALVMLGAVLAEGLDSLRGHYGRSLKELFSKITGKNKNPSSTENHP
ncbi:MAG TPA: CHASE2 domain-containing protein [Pyrinomonadaceae bacterium]|nr:CHASE2 domain-containing protein [Pyrinomonadaceae bacterium]